MRKIKRLENYSDSIIMPKKKGRKSGSKSKRIRSLKTKRAVKDYKYKKALINAIWKENKEEIIKTFREEYPDFADASEDKIKASFYDVIKTEEEREVKRLTDKYTQELKAQGYDQNNKEDAKKIKIIVNKKIKKNLNMRKVIRNADKIITPSSLSTADRFKHNLRKSLTSEETEAIRSHDRVIRTNNFEYQGMQNGCHIYTYKTSDGTVVTIKRQQYDAKLYTPSKRK